MNNLHICANSLDNFLKEAFNDGMWRALRVSGGGKGREKMKITAREWGGRQAGKPRLGILQFLGSSFKSSSVTESIYYTQFCIYLWLKIA